MAATVSGVEEVKFVGDLFVCVVCPSRSYFPFFFHFALTGYFRTLEPSDGVIGSVRHPSQPVHRRRVQP
jgi:hypothetical protein